MNQITHFQNIEDSLERLSKGAFLVVKNRENKTNVMSIGWGMFGILWRRPTLMVAIRPPRYTFSLIKNAEDFTVTIPLSFSNMSKEIQICGTKSGKNCDKFKECGLTTIAAQKTHSPILKTVGRFYECKIVQTTKMDEKKLSTQIDQEIYEDKAYHTLYFGEIVSAYEITDL